MKKIAILRCLRSNDVCTGYACLQAFQHRKGTFERYVNEPVELMAYFSCNGCNNVSLGVEGLNHKLDYLKKIGVDAVHIGVCTKHRDALGKWCTCPTIKTITDYLNTYGIDIIEGTHPSKL